MKKTQQQVQKGKSEDFHHFRLFSYLSMAIVTMAIIVGLYFVSQHVILEERQDVLLGNQELQIKNQEYNLINQKNILENQDLLEAILVDLKEASDTDLKNTDLLNHLLNESQQHEEREELILGNNTSTNVGISSENSQRLNLLLDYFNITIPESLKIK